VLWVKTPPWSVDWSHGWTCTKAELIYMSYDLLTLNIKFDIFTCSRAFCKCEFKPCNVEYELYNSINSVCFAGVTVM